MTILAPAGYSQPDLDKRLSLEFTEAPLGEILREISRQGEVELAYSSRKLDLDQRITLRAEEQDLAGLLEKLADLAGLEYSIVEDHIVIKPAGHRKVTESGEIPRHTLSGYIRDTRSNEVLIGATVFEASTGKGTISNEFGYYSLALPEGRHTLSFSYIGYRTLSWDTELLADQVRDMRLSLEPSILKEVVISRSESDFDLTAIRTGNFSLEPRSVERMPALFGEQDVIKSLDALPGISLQGDGSTLFFVRGGNKDQNLILLDDAPLYNPAHFLGFFSTFIPEAVKDIKIYKGDIPAEYGGRLSSLIDVRTRDGNMNRVVARGSVSLVTAKASVEGPLSRGKSSFFISGRTSYFKWFMQRYNQNIRRFYFTDLNAKLNLRMGTRDRLHLSGYSGKDFFSMGPSPVSTSGISWGNVTGTLRWNHLFNEKIFSNTTLYGSRYDYYLLTSVENNSAWNSRISNLSLRTDFAWYASPGLTMKFGGSLSRHRFNPGNYEAGLSSVGANVPVIARKTGREWVLYASINQAVGSRLSLRYGIRASLWQNTGETFEFVYDENQEPVDTLYYGKGQVYHSYLRFEPRMGLTLRLGANSSLKASYARTTQYEQLVTNSISPFTTLEVYLPAGPLIRPQLADQVSLGYFRKITGGNLDLSIEAYFKKMYNQIDYRDHARMLLNPLVETELRFGQGEAYGLEILLKKYYGRLNGWVSYAYGRSTRQIEGINDSRPYPAFSDRPHDFSLYLSFNLKPRWIASLNWIYMTGSVFSSPTAYYYYNGYAVPVYEEKNNDRLPDYHRLDLSTEIRLNKNGARYEHNLVFTLYNLYGRKNPIAVNFNKTLNGNGRPVVPGDLFSPPELVPSMIFLYTVVPAVSYSFKF